MRLSLLAGYAGTDILEGIYKSFAVQKTYVAPYTSSSRVSTGKTTKTSGKK